MILNRTTPLLMVGLTAIVSGCTGHSEEQRPSSATATNLMDSIPPEMKRNPEARRFFESLVPTIERNEKVRKAIKDAVATSTDPRVEAFHEFLSRWHLRWPVVKEGAFGEGGIGFSWNKELERFQGGVDATGTIEDRYTLQIILDCDVSKDYQEVTFTRLRFHFTEVKEVRVPPEGADEGGAMVTYETRSDRWLGEKEWRQLKGANWDFSKIGINVISNTPIPNIRQVWK